MRTFDNVGCMLDEYLRDSDGWWIGIFASDGPLVFSRPHASRVCASTLRLKATAERIFPLKDPVGGNRRIHSKSESWSRLKAELNYKLTHRAGGRWLEKTDRHSGLAQSLLKAS